MPETEAGVLEWLISGGASARLLDFFIAYRDFDYSETYIAKSSGVSKRTVCRELPKLESVNLIVHTRKVGRAKMFKMNPESPAARSLEKFAFDLATERMENLQNTKTASGLIQASIPASKNPIH